PQTNTLHIVGPDFEWHDLAVFTNISNLLTRRFENLGGSPFSSWLVSGQEDTWEGFALSTITVNGIRRECGAGTRMTLRGSDLRGVSVRGLPAFTVVSRPQVIEITYPVTLQVNLGVGRNSPDVTPPLSYTAQGMGRVIFSRDDTVPPSPNFQPYRETFLRFD